jgi:hypothetical protein
MDSSHSLCRFLLTKLYLKNSFQALVESVAEVDNKLYLTAKDIQITSSMN